MFQSIILRIHETRIDLYKSVSPIIAPKDRNRPGRLSLYNFYLHRERKGDIRARRERGKEKEKVGIEAVGEGATRGTFSRPDPLGRSKHTVPDRIIRDRSGSVRSSILS